MESNDVRNQVVFGGQHEGFQVAATAEADNQLHNDGGGDGAGGAMVMAVTNGGAEGGLTEKRRRGRPRKQLGEIQQEVRMVVDDLGGQQKRGRGRPKGSGKWQVMATSLGLNDGETVVSKLTPYIIQIKAGENIVQRILSFSQMTCDSFCILSACGTVSSVDFINPAAEGGIKRYQGEYTIVRLNGSHTYDEKKGVKNHLLSVQLADSSGSFWGGAVAASLIASGPTQIIVSTFKQKLRQQSTNLVAPRPNEAAPSLQAENSGAPETPAPAQRIYNIVQPSLAEPTDWDSLHPS